MAPLGQPQSALLLPYPAGGHLQAFFSAVTDEMTAVLHCALGCLLWVWMRHLWGGGFAKVQVMTCIKKARKSHRTVLLAAGKLEEMQDLGLLSVQLISLGRRHTKTIREQSCSPRPLLVPSPS